MANSNFDYVEHVQKQAQQDDERNRRAGGGGNVFADAQARCIARENPLHSIYVKERYRLERQKPGS